MDWKLPKMDELRTMVEKWKQAEDIVIEPDESAKHYRNLLLEIHKNVAGTLGIDRVDGHEYEYDSRFGLEMYEKMHITSRTASDDKFWIGLGVFAVPDLVFWRWGPGAHERFYRNSRRIWLKVLWWYIHLSWQGNREETERCIAGNSTDTIVQLVERSGPHGYRVELYRTIMKRYAEHCRRTGKEERLFFRRLMKLNTARLAVMEPSLCEGKEEGYVGQLFAALGNQN